MPEIAKPENAKTVKPIPEGYHSVTPYMIVSDAQRFIDFFDSVFGAKVIFQLTKPDGTIGHTELRLGDSVIMVSEAAPSFPPNNTMLHVYVEDVDTVYGRAIDAGATPISPVADQFYGDRSGGVTEPCGNMIWIATHVEDVSHEETLKRAAARG